MTEIVNSPGAHAYRSELNDLGIEGYNLISNPILAHRFPMPSRINAFYQDFCTKRGVEPAKIPLAASLPKHDDEDMRPLVTAAVVMVFEKFVKYKIILCSISAKL